MRTASRVFFAIGLFALIADVIFASGARWHLTKLPQGPVILTFFMVACFYISLLMRRQGAIELDGLALPEPEGAHDEEIHLPGPSWWPAAYGVAGFTLVWGLVFKPAVLIAGIVLLVLTTIGWGLESVRDYRREIAHAKPHGPLPPVPAIELAHEIVAFRRLHGGADAVVQHLGRGGAEVVLVGADGAWGSLVARDVALARTAAELAGTTLHTSWPSGLGARVRTGEEQWRAMGGEGAFSAATGHEAPRDGATQIAAKVFLSLGIFAVFADLLFAVTNRFHRANAQGMAILTAFGLANFFLYVGLKNAKARPEDRAYAGEDDVTIEPQAPPPPVDLATLHLPGPSWWPAFFAPALGCLVWGLVFSRTALLVGVGLTVLCCIGWGVESVREYRQQIAGHH